MRLYGDQTTEVLLDPQPLLELGGLEATAAKLSSRTTARDSGTLVRTASPMSNIPAEVTIQELLADNRLVPGIRGIFVRVPLGEVLRFADLAQLTINHDGAEFLLSREVLRSGKRVRRRWRLYSGTAAEVPPPTFYDPHAPGGGQRIERIVAHTHPRPVPYDPLCMQPSAADLQNLDRIKAAWRQVHGSQTEPFGRIIWGLNPGETTIYGIDSVPGNAVPPPWLRRP